jgi:hypothetical protein
MNDEKVLVIVADCPESFVSAFLKVMPLVSKDIRRKLKYVMMSVSMSQGDGRLFERFNGRSVAEILEESKEILDSQPIASGDVEGMRFELFERPGTPDGDSPGPAS